MTLRIPPLRERKEDIPFLAQHFVETFCKSQGLPLAKLPIQTIEWLGEYPWPGNVRELKNALEAGVVMSRDGIIHACDLNVTELREARHPVPSVSSSLSLEDSERKAILRALEQSGWVQKDAAELLGISRRALHYKIRKFRIEISGKRAGDG